MHLQKIKLKLVVRLLILLLILTSCNTHYENYNQKEVNVKWIRLPEDVKMSFIEMVKNNDTKLLDIRCLGKQDGFCDIKIPYAGTNLEINSGKNVFNINHTSFSLRYFVALKDSLYFPTTQALIPMREGTSLSNYIKLDTLSFRKVWLKNKV